MSRAVLIMVLMAAMIGSAPVLARPITGTGPSGEAPLAATLGYTGKPALVLPSFEAGLTILRPVAVGTGCLLTRLVDLPRIVRALDPEAEWWRHAYGELRVLLEAVEAWHDPARADGRVEPTDTPAVAMAVRTRHALEQCRETAQTQGEQCSTGLGALGVGALPWLTTQVALAEPAVAVRIVRVIRAHGYAPAAGQLAVRLLAALAMAEPGPIEETGPPSDVQEQQALTSELVQALELVGGSDEAASLAEVLRSRQLPPKLWVHAFGAVVGSRPELALALLEEMKGPPPASDEPWWVPPPPVELVERSPGAAGRAVWRLTVLDQVPAEQRYGSGPSRALVRSEDEAGPDLLVFNDAYLGGALDLWIAELAPDGTVSAPLYLGTWGLLADDGGPAGPGTLRRVGDLLDLRLRGGPRPMQWVSLLDVRRDSDGDGLTDLVEQHLGLSPDNGDTDRDGLGDGVDRSPNGILIDPRTPEQDLELALLEQLSILGPLSPNGLVLVVGSDPLAWRGRRGATITMDDEVLQHYLGGTDKRAEVPALAMSMLSQAELRDPKPQLSDEVERLKQPGDRIVRLAVLYGGLSGQGFDIVMRRSGNRWLVRALVPTWMS